MGKRERKKAYKDMINEINNTSGLRKSTFMADELAELEKQIEEEKNRGQYIQQATEMEIEGNYNEAIKTYKMLQLEEDVTRVTRLMADDKVKHLDYDKAIELYESIGDKETARNIRELKAEQNAVKVDQTVVQGNQITKTEIKDSVLNRSNVGTGSTKAEELREAKALLDDGIIDDDEFKQMKKEILGK